MKLTPNHFPPVMAGDLRIFWRAYRDPDVRRLILEVHRAREAQELTHRDAQTAIYACQEQKFDEVKVRLARIAERIYLESVRLGYQGSIPVDVGRPKGFTHGLQAAGMALNRSANVPFNGMDAFDPSDDDDTGD